MQAPRTLSSDDVSQDDWESFLHFRQLASKQFRRVLGPDGTRKKSAVFKKDLEPTRSVHYPLALRTLTLAYGEDAVYTEQEFKSCLQRLDYPFVDDKGEQRGSGNDYMKVLKSFCDGTMKGGVTHSTGVDVAALNTVCTSLAARSPLRTRVAVFERGANSGHGRLSEALAFVLWAQLERCLLVERA
jgi:hypothetical protein